MDFKSNSTFTLQPSLFNLGDSATGTLELIPRLWFAAEAITSPDLPSRIAALEVIKEEHAARLSPLISYILATRLTDPELDFRKSIVELISETLHPDEDEKLASDQVREHLMYYLAKLNDKEILALLQVAENDATIKVDVGSIIKICPLSGEYLVSILVDRSNPHKIRELAAYYIGKIGYLDALPAIERLTRRLETRIVGQKRMSFSEAYTDDETRLLPALRTALWSLQSP